ncbi:MAG: DUF4388 domain-containing protein [Myxococcaceae bacterium]
MARILIVEDQPELASLVAAAARTRGHSTEAVHTGQDAQSAIDARPFDAAIVDLLLPDMRGSEVLEALRRKDIAAFAVSGVFKGDRFAREAVGLHGARAFFEKPFELNQVLDALEAVTGPAENVPSEEELPTGLADPFVDAALPFADREHVWSSGEQPERPAPSPTFAASGSISAGSIPRLLNAFYQARHTGELKLRHGQVTKLVLFEEGRPVYAASNLAQERFARFCVRQGAMSERDLSSVAELARESNLRTGEAMLRLGLIAPEQRRTLLLQQVKEIIWSTFSWTEGEYAFVPRRVSARADLVRLSVFPGDLILDGTRREPLVSLRRKVGPERRLFPTADAPYGLHELTLSGDEALLLASTDGSKTVEDVLSLTDLTEREALAALHGLELAGLLEERRDERKQRRISFGL